MHFQIICWLVSPPECREEMILTITESRLDIFNSLLVTSLTTLSSLMGIVSPALTRGFAGSHRRNSAQPNQPWRGELRAVSGLCVMCVMKHPKVLSPRKLIIKVWSFLLQESLSLIMNGSSPG